MLPRIGFVGWGRFGRALGGRFSEAGASVRAYDPEAPAGDPTTVPDLASLAAESDAVVLAVPVARVAPALLDLRPRLGGDHLVFDVGSVKAGPMADMASILGDAVPWAGTHPLFGPTSLALDERPLRVVLCAAPSHPDAVARVRAIFETVGCETVLEDPETHDRLLAESHAITYFIAKGVIDAGLEIASPLAPPSARAIARAVEAVREDAAHLFASLHRQNRYAGEARRRLLEALDRADAALRRPATGAEAPHREGGALAIPDLGERSPRLREARERIDAIDDRILDLLVHRARMARSAREAKAEMGHGVHDPRREERLLDARRERARALGLDPDTVAEVFEAVLRFSRRLQVDVGPEEGGSPG